MTPQTDLSEYANRSDSVGPDDGEGGQTLFRLSSDPFVNAGAADLVRQVDDALVSVSRSRIDIESGADVDRLIDQLRSITGAALTCTHRRKAVAHEINHVLDELGADPQDSRRIPSPQVPFPAVVGPEQTVFENDTVDGEALDTHGIPLDRIERVDEGDSETLYSLSPTFVGNNSSRNFPRQQERFEDYFETLAASLRGEFEADDSPCMACGATELPAYQGVNRKLEFNQTFTVFASSSGQTRALGTGARQSAHRGRCVSCLVAGFYYALMPKIVRPTDSNENDVRVFTPEGDFVELKRISGDLSVLLADIDEPVDGQYARSRTLGEIQTSSRGIQILEVYSLIYRHVNREYGDGLVAREISYRPTGLVSYISRVGRTREILAFERIDPDRWAYDAVARQEFTRADGSTNPYWPVQDVLWWFGTVGDGLTPAKDNLAFGILQQDLGRLERGTFELTKAVISMSEDEYVPPYPHPGHTHHYFNTIMSQSVSEIDDIDDDAVEAIKDVATSIGRVFHGGEDIGVLINLQNASTATEFLRAFEKASMQAQKQSVQEAPMPWDASKDESVATVLKLIKNRSTFDPTKRMFVIHAALAAQYANVATDGPDDTQPEAHGPDEGGA